MKIETVKKITRIFVIAALFVILAYDVWAVWMGGTESTISQVLADWTIEYGPATHLMMFAMGHFIWPMYVPIDDKRLG